MSTTARRFRDALPARFAADGIDPDTHEFDLLLFEDDDETRFAGRCDAVFLDQISVFAEHGDGVGGRLMRICLRLADEHDITVVLNPWSQAKAFGRGLDQAALEAWYAHLGFVWDLDHLMVRCPHTPIPAPHRRTAAPAP